MSEDRITVWRSPSGHLHARRQCTAAGPARNMTRRTMTRAEYDEAWPLLAPSGAMVMCRCLRHNGWGTENARRYLRERLAERRATYRGRNGQRPEVT